MSSILVPVSVFIKEHFSTSISYLSQLPIYLFILFIIVVISKRGIPINNNTINTRVILGIMLFLGLQLIAMLLSFSEIGDNILNKNPIKEFIKLCIFIIFIFLHYLVVKLIIIDKKTILSFISGIGIALILVLGISFLQLMYITLPENPFINKMVNFIGHFEDRHNRDFYYNGSYVQTLERINGLNAESGYLAVQLLVAFVPFIISSIKNKVNIFSLRKGIHSYNPLLHYLLLFLVIIILFYAKTTTGLISILVIATSLLFLLQIKRKITYTIMLMGLVYIGLKIGMHNPNFMGILNEYLFNKAETVSTMNRYGGTVALIITWLQHLTVGVGWNYQDYYLFKNVPSFTTNNWEFHNVFVENNFYPILCIFFGWLAQFGTVIVIIVLIYIYKLLKDLRVLSKKAQLMGVEANTCLVINSIKDSAHYFVVFYLISSLLSFQWYDSYYLIIFFYFVSFRHILQKTLK